MDVIEIVEDLEQLDGLEGTQMYYAAFEHIQKKWIERKYKFEEEVDRQLSWLCD
jgi:hypothetical protein